MIHSGRPLLISPILSRPSVVPSPAETPRPNKAADSWLIIACTSSVLYDLQEPFSFAFKKSALGALAWVTMQSNNLVAFSMFAAII
jgi:hypothetical protein